MTAFPPSPRPAQGGRAAGIALRPARPADLDAIATLEDGAFAGDRLTRRRIRALIAAKTGRMVVAERGGNLVGYALVLLRRGSAVARLYSLAVAAGEAGRGIGRRLVEAAQAAAVAAGARRLRLEVRADNARAIALYTVMGYGAIGERRGYYEDGMTALRYDKPLAETGA